MEDRYKILFKYQPNDEVVDRNSVVIQSAVVLHDTKENKELVLIKFLNDTDKVINKMVVNVSADRNQTVKFTYSGEFAAGSIFGQKTPIDIKSYDESEFNISILDVTYEKIKQINIENNTDNLSDANEHADINESVAESNSSVASVSDAQPAESSNVNIASSQDVERSQVSEAINDTLNNQTAKKKPGKVILIVSICLLVVAVIAWLLINRFNGVGVSNQPSDINEQVSEEQISDSQLNNDDAKINNNNNNNNNSTLAQEDDVEDDEPIVTDDGEEQLIVFLQGLERSCQSSNEKFNSLLYDYSDFDGYYYTGNEFIIDSAKYYLWEKSVSPQLAWGVYVPESGSGPIYAGDVLSTSVNIIACYDAGQYYWEYDTIDEYFVYETFEQTEYYGQTGEALAFVKAYCDWYDAWYEDNYPNGMNTDNGCDWYIEQTGDNSWDGYLLSFGETSAASVYDFTVEYDGYDYMITYESLNW